MALAPGPPAALLLGVLGLVVGSFANVVIYRVPAGRSIVRPGSACPKCGASIRARDNVPIVSWLFLRGRCRDCKAPIPVRYPLVEALVGGLFAGMGLRFGLSWTAGAEAVLAAGLVALGFIDLDHMLLPRKVVYTTLALVGALLLAGAAASGDWHRLLIAAACGAVAWTLFFAINYVSPRALGFGDVRLALLIGLGLGWVGWAYAFLGFVVAAVLGSVVGVSLMAAGRASRRTPVPFGTFLAAGAMLSALAGSPVVNWYLGQLHA
ncbi:MAG TPA: prepilin peptidase [Acidimicrobiales bacterium]|nr:prepilin peptidase [Acidimicrobiales bacterium]